MNSSGSWAGAYAGVHVGAGDASYDGIYDGTDTPGDRGHPSDLDLDGVVGGAQIGYNRQTGTLVYGVEADFTLTDFEDSGIDRDGQLVDKFVGEVDWLATIRGRAGIARDNVLLYATAGVAFANASYTANDGPIGAPIATGSVDFDDVGYVVGGGVEVMRGNRMSFRVEGLYYGFDDRVDTSTLVPDSDPGDFTRFDDVWVVRAGFNIKLGGGRSAGPALK